MIKEPLRRDMTVEEVIGKASEWMREKGRGMPHFCGAHLLGSLNGMSREDKFPSYLDVDIALVIDRTAPEGGISLPYRGLLRENEEVSYEGLMLEAVYLSKSVYATPEEVLSNPTLAWDLAKGSILADRKGWLGKLRAVVQKEFPKREWVLQRMAVEKALVGGTLLKMKGEESLEEAAFCLAWAGIFMAGLVTVANLEPPTHRRGLILMKRLLEQWDRPDIHERVLSLMGYAPLKADEVEGFLKDFAEIFDYALKVHRTPTPFSFKLSAHLRPYIIESTRAMIGEGHHREAMFWITIGMLVCHWAVQADGGGEERLYFQKKVGTLVGGLGLDSMEAVRARLEAAESLAAELAAFSEKNIAGRAESLHL